MKGFQIPFGYSGNKHTLVFLPKEAQHNVQSLNLRVSINDIKRQKDDMREKIKEQSIGRIN